MEEVSTRLTLAEADGKRAVIYIRVSTKQQAVRDGNPEGYSLPTQRKACQAKAEALGAVIVEEYIDKDSATSADKRLDFQRLLERVIDKRDVDYVIVYKLDRFARNRLDDALTTMKLEAAGATLASCVEQIDGTAPGQLMQGMLAVMNEFYSRNLGDEIRRKTLIKIQEGGTHGCARIGYQNVGEGGRRYVVIDPERAALITWMFEAYATGEWTTKSLTEEVNARGLRTRGGPTTPVKDISLSQVHRILRSPYYKGIVVHNGVEYQGKHETLVDDETWQKVQDRLDKKRNGLKQREHHHYLKGTIWCGYCGSRLCVTYSTGKTGQRYPYYFCLGRHQKRTTCELTYRPLAVVEEQIVDHYRTVQLNADGLEATAAVLIAEASEQLATQKAEAVRQARRIKQLEGERTKLLHAHYADAVPLDQLIEEQARIAREMESLQAGALATAGTIQRIEANVAAAVELASNCHQAYSQSKPTGRRLFNQAFFKRVWVTEEGVVGWEYNQPFEALMTKHGKPARLVSPEIAGDLIQFDADPRSAYQRRGPGRLTRAFSPLLSSKDEHLAEREGFEPSIRLPAYCFSRAAPSTTRPPLHRRKYSLHFQAVYK